MSERVTEENKEKLNRIYYHNRLISDKKQTLLAPEGCIKNPNINAEIPPKEQIQGKNLICPYCLRIAEYYKFKFRKGELFECEHCKSKLRAYTLMYMYNIFQDRDNFIPVYAEWVYNNRTNGFFQKIDFQDWNQQLSFLGIQYEFWENYKRIKGENQHE